MVQRFPDYGDDQLDREAQRLAGRPRRLPTRDGRPFRARAAGSGAARLRPRDGRRHSRVDTPPHGLLRARSRGRLRGTPSHPATGGRVACERLARVWHAFPPCDGRRHSRVDTPPHGLLRARSGGRLRCTPSVPAAGGEQSCPARRRPPSPAPGIVTNCKLFAFIGLQAPCRLSGRC